MSYSGFSSLHASAFHNAGHSYHGSSQIYSHTAQQAGVSKKKWQVSKWSVSVLEFFFSGKAKNPIKITWLSFTSFINQTG